MPTLSPYQKRFIAKGRQEGREEGREEGVLATLHESVLDALSIRFNPVPEDIVQIVKQMTERNALKQLHRAAIQAETLEAFRNLVEVFPAPTGSA